LKAKKILIMSLMLCSSGFTGQDSLSEKTGNETEKIGIEERLERFEKSFLETKSIVDKQKKLKISGYVQAQMRIATGGDEASEEASEKKYKIGKFQGGDLPENSKSVFQIRRGRIKVAHQASYSQAVIQLDCVPSGVSIKDAYLQFSAPWLYGFGFKAGVYDRPFGFEISYSSSTRESPERSRMIQTLFPGERDMGASVEYAPSSNFPSWAQLFNLKIGVFSGNGINNEFDDVRDLIGRFGLSLSFKEIDLSINTGFSGYAGAVKSLNDTLKVLSGTNYIDKLGQKNKEVNRQYTGGDIQINYGGIPVLGQLSLRAEVIGGQQPGRAKSNESPKSSSPDASPIYVRDFVGFYGMAVLNIDPIKCQLVGKYDFFDPNLDLEKNTVKSEADVSFKTLGLGLVYQWDEHIRIMAYHDWITNEKTAIDPYRSDLKDNIFTLRFQYKF